jgi:anti-sigma B factor antagonist
MAIETFETDGVMVLSVLDRQITATNAQNLKAEVSSALQTGKKLVLDIGDVEFMDSIGLGALVSCLKTARTQGGEMRLCRLCVQVQTLFELVRLNKALQMFDSLDAAIGSYAKSDMFPS